MDGVGANAADPRSRGPIPAAPFEPRRAAAGPWSSEPGRAPGESAAAAPCSKRRAEARPERLDEFICGKGGGAAALRRGPRRWHGRTGAAPGEGLKRGAASAARRPPPRSAGPSLRRQLPKLCGIGKHRRPSRPTRPRRHGGPVRQCWASLLWSMPRMQPRTRRRASKGGRCRHLPRLRWCAAARPTEAAPAFVRCVEP